MFRIPSLAEPNRRLGKRGSAAAEGLLRERRPAWWHLCWPSPAPHHSSSPCPPRRRVLLFSPRWTAHGQSHRPQPQKGIFAPTVLRILSVPFSLRYGEIFVNHQAAAFLAGALSAITSSVPAAGTPREEAPSSSPGTNVAALSPFFTRERAELRVFQMRERGGSCWKGGGSQDASVPGGCNPPGCVSRQFSRSSGSLPLLPKTTSPTPPPHTHPPRFFLALSRQQQTAKETDRARITAPLSSEAATAAREPVAEGCGAAAGQSGGR